MWSVGCGDSDWIRSPASSLQRPVPLYRCSKRSCSLSYPVVEEGLLAVPPIFRVSVKSYAAFAALTVAFCVKNKNRDLMPLIEGYFAQPEMCADISVGSSSWITF